MVDENRPDPQFDAMTARLLHREALRRAAEDLNTTSGPGLEGVLARISAEVTADAARRTSGADTTETDVDARYSAPVQRPLVPRRPKP
jgi:hypothetical protein